MSTILSWNCQGLGSPEAVRSVVDLVRYYSPDILFLCETKRQESEMCLIKEKLNMDHGVWVGAVGRAGGLAIMWLSEVELSVRSSGPRYIDFEVKME